MVIAANMGASLLASLFLKRVSEKEPFLFRLAKKIYVPVLGQSMRHEVITVGVAVALLLASLGIAPFLGAEFIPSLDEGAIAMQIWRLPSISLEQSNEISMVAEQVLKEQFPEVETVISRTGRAEIATDPMGVEISDTYLMLAPGETWRYDSKEALIARELGLDEVRAELLPADKVAAVERLVADGSVVAWSATASTTHRPWGERPSASPWARPEPTPSSSLPTSL